MNRRAIITIALLLLLVTRLFTINLSNVSASNGSPKVYSIAVTETITHGTTEYITRALEEAESENAAAIVLRINTPGGLVDSTLKIIEGIMASPIPVITYVEPQGAIAASAGSFILVSGHIAAMSPGTTCGAAMPVTLSSSEEGVSYDKADEKTINFLAGHMRSIAEERGHDGDTAALFVTENLTLNVEDALERNIIDLTARSMEELLEKTHGLTIDMQGEPMVLNTADAEIIILEKTYTEAVTGVISNPQISFLLVIAGIYGLIIGFNAPQTYIPEAAGAIAFFTGVYGLGLININIFAVIMLVLGVLLLVAEALTPTYGVLSIAGISSVVLGGFFLPKEPLMPMAWLIGFRSITIGIGIGASILMLIILRGIVKIRHKKASHGNGEFEGSPAFVADSDPSNCLVLVHGELWRGKTEDGQTLSLNQEVEVVSRNGLEVVVKPINK